jgi:hypothetical protein
MQMTGIATVQQSNDDWFDLFRRFKRNDRGSEIGSTIRKENGNLKKRNTHLSIAISKDMRKRRIVDN